MCPLPSCTGMGRHYLSKIKDVSRVGNFAAAAAAVVVCPGAVYILMLILLPKEGLPVRRGRSWTQVISCEPSLHSNWSIRARACDWAVEREGG